MEGDGLLECVYIRPILLGFHTNLNMLRYSIFVFMLTIFTSYAAVVPDVNKDESTKITNIGTAKIAQPSDDLESAASAYYDYHGHDHGHHGHGYGHGYGHGGYGGHYGHGGYDHGYSGLYGNGGHYGHTGYGHGGYGHGYGGHYGHGYHGYDGHHDHHGHHGPGRYDFGYPSFGLIIG